MKFLIDNALSPQVAKRLLEKGYDAKHIRDYGMQRASDEEILELAKKEERILISADTDFGTILAFQKERVPSVIIFREAPRRPELQVALLVKNLPLVGDVAYRGQGF
ncbi:DUF5615 family PIN-like protein [Candidatus Calescamantes bacterium]|nr:DUF5615 family PIN-like protein [Candidatus Calescamantes bacterium]